MCPDQGQQRTEIALLPDGESKHPGPQVALQTGSQHSIRRRPATIAIRATGHNQSRRCQPNDRCARAKACVRNGDRGVKPSPKRNERTDINKNGAGSGAVSADGLPELIKQQSLASRAFLRTTG